VCEQDLRKLLYSVLFEQGPEKYCTVCCVCEQGPEIYFAVNVSRVQKRSISFMPKINKMMLRKEGKFNNVRKHP
jgi:hypothetical protein